MRRLEVNLPDRDLAYLSEGTEHFSDYVNAVEWAQDYAAENRKIMLDSVLRVLRESLPPFTLGAHTVQCHHNYVSREHHFGEDVLVTRKGAVRAGAGELGIIPGSMGARSYIVRGKGNPESFCWCSHGAGRKMSRGEAKRRFTVEDHAKAVKGVECRVDAGVVDETPGAYKPIEDVMLAQRDLVEVVATLKQVLCVKG
jgi:tRNA-splicing ligase RtcB